MKTRFLMTATVLALTGCVAQQPPPSGVPLAAQSTPAPAYSPLDNANTSIVPASHANYARQRNPLEGAAYGTMVGAGLGQAIGRDTESTAYGAAAGALIGYGSYR